jgi:large subunit ribosomal protein L10
MADVNTSQNRLKKEAIKAELVEKVEKSQAMVFANYQGLTHQQLEGLKKNLKKVDAEFVAAKNTILLRALEGKIDQEAEKDKFTQPTGALFIYGDIVDPLKVLSKSIKDHKLPAVKFGIVEGRVVTDKEVAKLATLPPLPVLRAQLLGQMMSPIQGLHRALSWNMQSLVMTLNAIKEKKGANA